MLLSLVGVSISGQTAIPVFPKYEVLGVVYAPPGASSSVTYGNSTAVGTTQSITAGSSNMQVQTTQSMQGGGFLGFGQTKVVQRSTGWTTQTSDTNTIAIQTTAGNSISTAGPISSSLGVNHDNDVIYILLNPVFTTSVNYDPTGTNISSIFLNNIESNGCDLSSSSNGTSFYQQLVGCDPNQYPFPDIVGIPVWCLKNPYYPGQGCSQWQAYVSRSWDQSYWGPTGPSTYPAESAGLTLQDFADILQADPFVTLNGSTVNVCHPSYGPNLDPNNPEVPTLPGLQPPPGMVNPTRTPTSCGSAGMRFQAYGTVQYPEPGPNGLPTTYNGKFSYTNTSTELNASSDTHTTSYSRDETTAFANSFDIPGGIVTFNASISNTNSDTITLQNSSSNETSTQKLSTADYSITGPQLSDAYTGPATYNVYLDNTYGTYAFYSNLTPPIKLSTIGVSPSSLAFQTATQILGSSASQVVTLTNLSTASPMTMVSPAVTFSDPGFVITPDGQDFCSNAYLQPMQSCTLDVSFAPQISDASNPITLANTIAGVPAVLATMIAAGTENASSYQNVLVTAQVPVSGLLVHSNPPIDGSSRGGLLLPSGAIVSQQNPLPYVYIFPKTQPGSFPSQSFVFTNYYSADVVITGLGVGNSLNFAVSTNGLTNPCYVGQDLPYGATCNLSILFMADQSTSVQTTINVSGYTKPFMTVPQSGQQVLASAGAIGTSSYGITVNAGFDNTIVAVSSDSDGAGALGFSTTAIITNNSAVSLQLGFALTGAVSLTEDPDTTNSCYSIGEMLGPGQSCSYGFQPPPNGKPMTLEGSLLISGTANNGTIVTATVQVEEDIFSAYTPPPCTTNPCLPVMITPGATQQSSTVRQGDTAHFAFNIAPTSNVYPAPVTFSASGLPMGAVATFSQTTIAATAGKQTITLSLQTPATKALSPALTFHKMLPMTFLALLLLPLNLVRRSRSTSAGRGRYTLLAICSLTSLLCFASVGCVTPAGSVANASGIPQTYAIVITATCGSSAQSITFPLTIE